MSDLQHEVIRSIEKRSRDFCSAMYKMENADFGNIELTPDEVVAVLSHIQTVEHDLRDARQAAETQYFLRP